MVMEYELSFAGIPFCSDIARAFRIPTEGKDQEDKEDLPPRKYQPKERFLDELDKILPFDWINDLQTPPQYGGFNIQLLATTNRTSQNPRIDEVKLGQFYYPPTAIRYGIFRGLATSSMVKAMLVATQDERAGSFVMKCNPVSPSNSNNNVAEHTITTSLFMLPPRPVAEGTEEGLYIVTLVDERFWFGGTPITLHPTYSSTWSDLLSQVATALGITLTIPSISSVYGAPEPDSELWMNTESASYVLDALATNVGCEVVRNLDGTYALKTAAQSYAVAMANRGNAKTVIRVGGGDMFSSGNYLPAGDLTLFRNTVVPQAVTVSFPKYIYGGDPVPHFLNPRAQGSRPSTWYEKSFGDVYNIRVPVTSGGQFVSGLVGTSEQVVHNTAKALYSTEVSAVSGAIPDNSSGLMALALQVSQDRFNEVVLDGLDEIYDGIINWTPETIHDIVWTYSEDMRGATTRVFRPEWSIWVSELQHNIGISGSFVTSGLGGLTVAQTWRDTSGIPFLGVNLVTVGSGLSLISGAKTSGGVTEVILTTNVPLISGLPTSIYTSGVITSGFYVDYPLQDVMVMRLLGSGSTYFRSLMPPPSIVGDPTGREFEIVNASPLPNVGESPSTYTYLHEDPTGTSQWRINTPDGYPLIQQPQESIRLKYTDGRWKPAELRPLSPFTNTMGGGGGPLSPLIAPGTTISQPTLLAPIKIPFSSGMPNYTIPSSGYVNIGMGYSPIPQNSESGINTLGSVPRLEFVNESGMHSIIPQSPFVGWFDKFASEDFFDYLAANSPGNPTSGLYSGTFSDYDLLSGDQYFLSYIRAGFNTIIIDGLFSGQGPGPTGGFEYGGPWVIRSGPWQRPSWYMSGQIYDGFLLAMCADIASPFYAKMESQYALSGVLGPVPGYRVGTPGIYPPQWAAMITPQPPPPTVGISGGPGIEVEKVVGPDTEDFLVSLTSGGITSGGYGSGSITSGTIASGAIYVNLLFLFSGSVYSGAIYLNGVSGILIDQVSDNSWNIGWDPTYFDNWVSGGSQVFMNMSGKVQWVNTTNCS